MKLSEYVKQQLNEDDMAGQAGAAASQPPVEPETGADAGAADTGSTGGEPAPMDDDEIGKVIYTIEATDREEKLKALINYIMGIGNQKRSFDIVVAPGDESIEKTFNWDGQGTDKIKSVNVEKEGEQGDEGGEPAAAPAPEGDAAAQPAAQPASESAFAKYYR